MTHDTTFPEAPSTPMFHGRIGMARRDMTPPPGIYARNWGAATHDDAEGIHRPLELCALYVEELVGGGEPLLLVGLDLGVWRTDADGAYFREAVAEALGLAPWQVLLALTHTHSGPSFSLSDTGRPGGGKLVRPYMEFLRTAILEAAREAKERARPALLEAATGSCHLATSRDLQDPDASQAPRRVTGFDPEVAADPTLTLLRLSEPGAGEATHRENGLLGLVVNYACHPTILAWENRLISPDYPGAMRETIRAAVGDVPILFLQGASGELAAAWQYTGDPSVADRAGKQVGYSVLATLWGMLAPGHRLVFEGVRESGAPLALWRPRLVEHPWPDRLRGRDVSMELALRDDLPDSAELELRREEARAKGDGVVLEQLERRLRVRASVGEGASARVEQVVWRLGEIDLVSLGNEVYSSLARELREVTPRGRSLVIATTVNQHRGYLSPAPLYDERCYTTWQTPYARGGLERTIECLADVLRETW